MDKTPYRPGSHSCNDLHQFHLDDDTDLSGGLSEMESEEFLRCDHI